MTDVTDALQLTVQHPRPGLAITIIAGDVDTRTADTLRHKASGIIEQGHPHLVLDLSQVGSCDSAGLSALIGLWHAAQAVGGALRLAAVPDRLMRMLALTGVDAVLPVHTTAADAASAMTAAPSTSAGVQGCVTDVSTGSGAGGPTGGEHMTRGAVQAPSSNPS
ncbi:MULTISPECIES: STAS domain-containing protein [unclassified Streptomyces]|uniref:STAS domain-containing protein n=1 Tax=unclassified Streptomyces TaxID=2593676 RepID=UPI000F7A65F2|nr:MULTISPECIES: STAS domain-containing protein [unclassified Streptomyces]NUV95677.1 STAS domain-containing protein [Streptomyces sp. KAI 90]RSS18192.1 anti-sigma factor antagonist [Streptomyces sp. WAC05458]RSS97932.1 anti-sigma factor antagonist [Streptomyces sp. WAC02707]